MPPKKERDPKPLGDLLQALVQGRGWGPHMALGRLRASWADVVGDQVASRSEPVSLRDGVLTIKADGSAWATELTLLGPSLASTCDAFLGEDADVRQVRVTAGSGRPSGAR